jgi:hypothetical protein
MRLVAPSARRVVVFRAEKIDAELPEPSFAPFDYLYGDDELVYPVTGGFKPGYAQAPAFDEEVDQSGTIPSALGSLGTAPDSDSVQIQSSAPPVASALGSAAHEAASSSLTNEQNTTKNYSKPDLCFTRELGSRHPLRFECLINGSYAVALLDSGASRSFVSTDWCKRNQQKYSELSLSGRVANGSPLTIPGQLSNAWLKLGPYRSRRDGLVAEVPAFDAVLGHEILSEV